jgi:hypothetical protein
MDEAIVGCWDVICRVFMIGQGLIHNADAPLAPETIDNIEDTLRFIAAALAAAKAKHPAPMRVVEE